MFLNIIEKTREVLSACVDKDDVVVDLTAGNGHDTVFLAQHSHHVYAFDIQIEAIDKTREKLETNKLEKHVTLIHDSHENLDQYLDGEVKAFVFNLGYLPGADKAITTQKRSTLIALEKALDRLMPGGIISMTVYPGHDEGEKEANALALVTENLSSKHYTVLKYQFLNRHNAPYNLLIHKHPLTQNNTKKEDNI